MRNRNRGLVIRNQSWSGQVNYNDSPFDKIEIFLYTGEDIKRRRDRRPVVGSAIKESLWEVKNLFHQSI